MTFENWLRLITSAKPIRVVDLVVEICYLSPLPRGEWGFTVIFDTENGPAGWVLNDHFPYATKAT